MRYSTTTLIFAACMLVLVSAKAAEPQPLFADDTPLAVTLEGPFATLRRDRYDEPELPGTLRYTGADGLARTLAVEIKPRGNTRLSECRYPPLRVNFGGADTAGTLFEGQETLKLVRHCERARDYAGYVEREYQIYRAYNRLTDRSFRVRWANIEYVDASGRVSPYTQGAFLIEEDWAVAERLGMSVAEQTSMSPEELEPVSTTAMALFQYMVGNADWSATKPDKAGDPCCHNGAVLVPPDGGRYIVMPYDFDQAGIINAEYATHNVGMGLNPTQRRYRGQCGFNTHLDAAIAEIEGRREAMIGEFATGDLTDRRRQRALGYFEDSFERIGDARTVERQIARYCED